MPRPEEGSRPPLTKNRRYEAHYDALNDQRRAASTSRAVTLPTPAYGPQPIKWADRPPAVWAWIQWDDRPAERVRAVATGWNDRIVVVEWFGAHGHLNTVVWRNAVTRRDT